MKVTTFTNANAARLIDETKTPEYRAMVHDLAKLREAAHAGPKVTWDDKRLAKIVRLRLLSDPGFPVWDVNYCYGQLKDGGYCRVELPWSQLPKSEGKMRATVYAQGTKDKVHVNGLGFFAAIDALQ